MIYNNLCITLYEIEISENIVTTRWLQAQVLIANSEAVLIVQCSLHKKKMACSNEMFKKSSTKGISQQSEELFL